MAREGARLLVTGRDRTAVEDVAARTVGVGVVADLSSAAGVDRCVAAARRALPRVDLLVNNAGVGWAGPFTSMNPKDADRIVRLDLVASIRLTGALLPGMIQRGQGHLVYVASIAGHVGVPHEAVYAAAKAGLIAFGESLRYELRGLGVAVTVVSPGAVRTPFFERRGRAYGRDFPPLISPDRVADATVRAVEGGRADVFLPGWMRAVARFRGAWPGAYRRLAARFG